MDILKKQLEFYRNRKAGCIFAAIVARNPKKYAWQQIILGKTDSEKIDEIIETAINEENISTLSIILPDIINTQDLVEFISTFEKCKNVLLEQEITVDNRKCLGFRVKVGNDLSWVSGFGNFAFLPKTRQAPYTEIAFRVKPRPHYEWHMKQPIKGVIHLAEMDMLGVPKRVFKKWWNASLQNTKKILGHSPDIHSAAKTTYSIPIKNFKE